MNCINGVDKIRTRYWLMAVALSAVALSGCSSIDFLNAGNADSEQVVSATAGNTADAGETALTSSPNPYLKNRTSISGKAQKRFQQALTAMDNEQWQQAHQPLLQLTIDYPNLSGAHLNLGICYRHMDQPGLAEDYFIQSIRANSNNLDAYNWLALVKREQGDFVAADKLYQQALNIWADHAASHYNLGVLSELYLGDFQRAREHFVNYQKLQTQPDKKIAGWIKDLQRRINAVAKNEAIP